MDNSPHCWMLGSYNFSINNNGAKCYVAKFPWGEMSLGRNFHGAKFLGAKCLGQVVHGANCPWGTLFMGRDVYGAKRPWGELFMGRVVQRAKCHGVSLDGSNCQWGKLSGNHCYTLFRAYTVLNE